MLIIIASSVERWQTHAYMDNMQKFRERENWNKQTKNETLRTSK